ncbi:hypothetical protein JW851_00950 [Candidatus Woesearchaeota archaeon]|nr:hypothetical protein [Candidatus Woesearchaeota archaeon]
METKWTLLLLAVGIIIVLLGVKGITGAAVSVSGAGFLTRTSIVSVVGIIAIAGLVIATLAMNKK